MTQPAEIDSSASLEKVIDVARRLSRPFELTDALKNIVDAGCQVLQADRASVLLFDGSRQELYSMATSAREEIRFDADKGIAGECLRDRRVIRVDDCYADPRFNPEIDKATGYRSKSLIAVPLIGMEDEAVGVMQLLNASRGHFDESDERLADMFAGFAAVAIQRARHLEDRLRTAKLERDLSLARDIQMSVLPEVVPTCASYELAVFSRPAEETGGDIYDLVQLGDSDDGAVMILLADATGHGIAAALSVTQVRAMLRMAARVGTRLDDLCVHLNNQLVADLPENRFVTAFLGILDPERHALDYHALGQGPLLHVKGSTGDCEKLGASSIPMGLLEQGSLEAPPAMVLEPGDVVVLLSDGFFEHRNPADEELGAERIIDVISSHRRENAEEILAALRRCLEDFAEGEPQDDDLTAIIVKRIENSAP